MPCNELPVLIIRPELVHPGRVVLKPGADPSVVDLWDIGRLPGLVNDFGDALPKQRGFQKGIRRESSAEVVGGGKGKLCGSWRGS